MVANVKKQHVEGALFQEKLLCIRIYRPLSTLEELNGSKLL